MDLVILAAGMGSRFGGLKQIEPIDEYGNFIIDYSIYDAKLAGFDKVIFLIKEENLEIFKETVGKRVEKYIKVEYAFQRLNDVPEGIVLPKNRVKPLGTAQAILSCKDLVSDKFIIINADDFYGRDAFMVAAKFLKNLKPNSKNIYGNIGYMAKNTITENGSVKRGVLYFDNKNKLEKLVESKLEKIDGKLYATPLDEPNNTKVISDDTLVSMNMFAFTSDIMTYLEDNYLQFFKDNMNNLDTCEYLIPTVVSDLIKAGKVNCDVLSTTSIWYGVTYKEDKDFVVKSIKDLCDNNVYPKGLNK